MFDFGSNTPLQNDRESLLWRRIKEEPNEEIPGNLSLYSFSITCFLFLVPNANVRTICRSEILGS